MVQQRLEVAERVGERAERDGPASRGQQPGNRGVRAAAVQPVPGDQGRGGPRCRQAAGGVAVDRDPVMGWDLLDEGLADQVVPEAVAGPGNDQRAGAERGVEQRERVRLGQPGQRGHADRVEIVARHREPAQHRGGGVVEVEETLGDRVPDRRRDSRVGAASDAAGQLQGEERVALRHPDDPGEHAGGGLDRSARLHQHDDLVVVERPQVDPDAPAGPVEARDRAGQGRSGPPRGGRR